MCPFKHVHVPLIKEHTIPIFCQIERDFAKFNVNVGLPTPEVSSLMCHYSATRDLIMPIMPNRKKY